MTIDEFYKAIEKEVYEDYIVCIKMKYTHEKEYYITNELYLFDGGQVKYEWQNDWWEGQQEVEVLGYIAVSDVEIEKVQIIADNFNSNYDKGYVIFSLESRNVAIFFF